MIDAGELTELVERDFVSAWSLIGEAVGADVPATDGLRWFHTGSAEGYLNPVLGTQLPDSGADVAIDALLAELRARGAPFVWWVLPSARPADLGARLAARGLRADDAWPAMAAAITDLAAAPTVPGLTIQRVTDEARLRVYSDLYSPILSPSPAFTDLFYRASLQIGFAEDAPELSFVGYLEGEPVATSSLITAAGAAGVYNVATVEHARGRGIGAAMTLFAVAEGARRGCEVASLQASTMGRPIYERLGFAHVADFVPYLGSVPD